jgi:hypothetical protein
MDVSRVLRRGEAAKFRYSKLIVISVIGKDSLVTFAVGRFNLEVNLNNI